MCAGGGGGVFVDISCRNQIQAQRGKRAVGVTYPGLCLGFLFWGLGGVDPKKVFGATQRREKSF